MFRQKLFMTLTLGLVFSALAYAELHAGFKKFNVGRDGLWETTTVVTEGPTKGKSNTQKNCVDVKASKDAVAKMLPGSNAATNCKTRVTKDTAESAESEQICNFGPVNTKVLSKMTKLSADSYQVEVDADTGGTHTKTLTTTKYLGPCSAQEKAALNDQMTKIKSQSKENCAKCKAQVKEMKDHCKTAKGTEKDMCNSATTQIESMCKMTCG